jgi:hypothetical protein
MKKNMTSPDQTAADVSRGISQQELGKFLLKLADLYASPELGNPALANALYELATLVKRGELMKTRGKKTQEKELSLDQVNELKILDHEAIRAFLADESKTKADLFSLASARFSIPISQLKRMKNAEVKQTINAALLHESSIEILSEEAGRDGANRKS